MSDKITNRDVLLECRKHIRDTTAYRYVDCAKCPFFPVTIKSGKPRESQCIKLSYKYGAPVDVIARLYDAFNDAWLDTSIDDLPDRYTLT